MFAIDVVVGGVGDVADVIVVLNVAITLTRSIKIGKNFGRGRSMANECV